MAGRHALRLLGAFLGSVLLTALCGSCPAAPKPDDYAGWSLRLSIALEHNDAPGEVRAVTTIGRRWPDQLREHWSGTVPRVVTDSEQARLGQPRIDLLQLLFDLKWLTRTGEPARWWRQLALSLLEQGKEAQAIAVATHITSARELIALQVDRRFDRISSASGFEHDVARAAEQELQERQKSAAEQPRSLLRIVDVTGALRLLGRYTEVVQLTDDVLQRCDAAPQDTSLYADQQAQLPWILDARALALWALGRFDDAAEASRRAARDRQNDIGLQINLALRLARLGRAQEALAALPLLDTYANLRGYALANEVHIMAARELGDLKERDVALSRVATYTKDSPTLHQHALVLAGHDDEAARVLAARLRDPLQRSDALVELQDYHSGANTTRQQEWRQHALALRDRPEIQRLIKQFGRIQSYPVDDL